MKKCSLVAVLLLALCLAGASYGENRLVTQVSTIDALITGVYDSPITLGDIASKGDFGHGTFNALDGEMILMEGRFYQVAFDGTVKSPPLSTGCPFATVTFFEKDREIALKPGIDLKRFTAELDRLLPTENIFYAIRIRGTFDTVTARSVPRQEKPYKPLAEAVKGQSLFNMKDVKGTIVGFRCPPYAMGVNVPGYHLHFLTADLKAGGHVLDFKIASATAEIDDLTELHIILPRDEAFFRADLSRDRQEELKRIER